MRVVSHTECARVSRSDEERFVSSISQVGSLQNATRGGDGRAKIPVSTSTFGDPDAGHDEPQLGEKERRRTAQVRQRSVAI